MIYLRNTVLISICITLQLASGLAEQRGEPPYREKLERGDYSGAFSAIKKRLTEIYDARVEGKRIPTDAISVKRLEEKVDLNALFKKRRVEGWFIEENAELHELHRAAGRALGGLEQYDGALNHLYQSLRFKTLEPGKDDEIFTEIARTHQKLGHNEAFVKALEAAYTLNPQNYEYSLQLGRELYRRGNKNKAFFHLARYIDWAGDRLEDPGILLMAGNLGEDLGRYLETVKYYRMYLQKKSDDGFIHFALGHLACKRGADYGLALSSLQRSLELLPQEEILRRSKAHEYMGDIYMSDREYDKAVAHYLETAVYQEKIKSLYDQKEREIKSLDGQIREVKSSLIKTGDVDRYGEYELLMDEKGKHEIQRREMAYAYRKLNAGGVRWNLAQAYERLEKPEEALQYYRQCVSLNYRARDARDEMLKIQLKINRGY